MAWCHSIKPLIQKEKEKQYQDRFIREAVLAFDRLTVASMGWNEMTHPPQSSSLGKSFEICASEYTTQKKQTGDDDKMELLLFMHEKSILGIPFFGRSSILKWFKEEFEGKIFQEYGFWDNTDPLENVSKKQWNQRKKAWSSVFEHSSFPAECGISVMLSRMYDFSMCQYEFGDKCRSLSQSERSAPLTLPKNMTLKDRATRLSTSIKDGCWVPDDFSNPSQAMRYVRAIEKDEIPDFVQARDFLAKHVLEKDITMDLLLSKEEELHSKFENHRQRLYSLDIPSSLQTPLFEQVMLDDNISAQINPSLKKKM